jgi:SAM-dependent methyltransferase
MFDFTNEHATGEHFANWIIGEVKLLLARGIDNFAELVEILPSVYPSAVLEILHKLQDERLSTPQIADLILSAAAPYRSKALIKQASPLLPPHPLDYEWRFSDLAIGRISSELRRMLPQYQTVALVATPSIAIHSDKYLYCDNVAYFGRDMDFVRSVCLHNEISKWEYLDLNVKPGLSSLFDLVVMDPPWYSEYIERFLWYSARLCREGGFLLFSMPGKGTRPGIDQEILRYQSLWSALGFDLMDCKEQYLPYLSPHFEQNTLHAAGIRNFSTTWRKGDLFLLRKMRTSHLPWPGDLEHQPWQEFVFGQVSIRVNQFVNAVSNDPRLIPIIPGNILPSVSRRDPTRSLVAVWTSGNRVFSCKSPRALIDALSRLLQFSKAHPGPIEYEALKDVMQTSFDSELFQQLATLIDLESSDLENA